MRCPPPVKHTLAQLKICLLFMMLLSKFSLTLSNCPDGLVGSGKTMSLCHTVHFCYTQGWLVLHIPDGETKKNHLCQVLTLGFMFLQPYNLLSFLFFPQITQPTSG